MDDDDRLVYIYGLVDPRTKCVGYVGSTVDPATRLKAHLSDARRFPQSPMSSALAAWLCPMLDAGVRPGLVFFEAVPSRLSEAAEDRWIAAHRAANPDLCNRHPSSRTPLVSVMGVRPARASLPASIVSEYRERHGLSQAQFARLIGVHYATVSRWEHASRGVPEHVGRMIALLDEKAESD